MNKYVFVALLALLLSIPSAYSQFSVGTPSEKFADSADLKVTMLNQDPNPAEPGKYVDVRFKVDNVGFDKAGNVEVELLPEYPFSLEPGREAFRSIGNLRARQNEDFGAVIEYKLRVDENAVEGENELKLRYRFNNQGWIEPEEFIVNVRTFDAILSVDSVTTEDEAFKPGKSSNVRIKLSNEADSLLQDVKVNLDLSEVPFVPMGSSNEKSVYQIKSKSDYIFNFELLADPEAAAGVYKVPLNVDYNDELGNSYSKEGTIGLVVGSKPDLSITLDETDVYESGSNGEVVVKVVNKGVTDVKFANLKIGGGVGYKILTAEEVYLGNIDSDDFESATFDVFVEDSKSNSLQIPFTLTYQDANNNEYKEEIALPLKLYTSAEAKKFGLKEGNNLVGIAIVALIVVAGLFYYFRYWKRKK